MMSAVVVTVMPAARATGVCGSHTTASARVRAKSKRGQRWNGRGWNDVVDTLIDALLVLVVNHSEFDGGGLERATLSKPPPTRQISVASHLMVRSMYEALR